MASVTYGKDIMASVIMAKVLWQMKLSLLDQWYVLAIHVYPKVAILYAKSISILPITYFKQKLKTSAVYF